MRILILSTMLCFALTACGIKGALVLPQPQPVKSAANPAAPASAPATP